MLGNSMNANAVDKHAGVGRVASAFRARVVSEAINVNGGNGSRCHKTIARIYNDADLTIRNEEYIKKTECITQYR